MRYVLDARTATRHFPGIGRYTINLARAMIPLLAPDEQLILLHNPTQPATWDLTALAGAQAQIMDIGCSPFSPAQQWLIPSWLRQLKANVYHSPYYLMPYYPGVPVLLTVYDLIPLLYPHYASLKARLLFRWATALALRTAQRITTISEASHRDLLAIYAVPPGKVTTIHLAADPMFQPQPPQTIAALRARLNLPEQYLLYVGSNKPHKNLPRLIEAFSRFILNLECGLQHLKLVVAGVWDTRYPEACRQAGASGISQQIQFLGPIAEADLPALYSGALAFVFPSEYEGFGLPVLEAMACGTPVACANTSSLPEVAGDAALLFEPTQVNSIAEALHRLVTDAALRTSLRQQGLDRAKQFSWRQTALETLALYQKVV